MLRKGGTAIEDHVQHSVKSMRFNNVTGDVQERRYV